jgi:ABC-type glycerol-3-phosphate transport system permease component
MNTVARSCHERLSQGSSAATIFNRGAFMGGALIAIIPVAILFSLFLNRIISGMALGIGRK